MPAPCIACSAALPQKAAFCPRCGRAVESSVVVKESPQSLLRQVASMLQKHSTRKLDVKFIGAWRLEYSSPPKKCVSIRFQTKKSFFEWVNAFVVAPLQGKNLFLDGSWADITIKVLQETGFDDAGRFAGAYEAQTGRNVEIVKKYM